MHLRAESREDKLKWMDALQVVKEMFSRNSPNSELGVSLIGNENGVVVSTEKLRQRLLEEGMSENAIQDSEHIMKSEFSALHNHLMVLNQKQLLLLDTLRQLEVSYNQPTLLLQLVRYLFLPANSNSEHFFLFFLISFHY